MSIHLDYLCDGLIVIYGFVIDIILGLQCALERIHIHLRRVTPYKMEHCHTEGRHDPSKSR